MMAVCGAGLLLIGYLTLTTGAYVLLRHRQGIQAVQFLHVAWPTLWPKVRVARGEHQIQLGISLAARGEFHQALPQLRAGLARAPQHLSGRLRYVDILQGLQRFDAAEAAYRDGLTSHSRDASYVRRVFAFLLERQKDAEVVALAGEILAASTPSDVRRLATLAAAHGAYHRGNYTEAETFLRDARLEGSPDAQLLLSKIDWECGYPELALWRLRALADAHPHDLAAHTELVRRLHERERHDEARRQALAFQIANPSLARPRVDLLRAYQQTGDTAALEREIDAILRDFAADPAALLNLAEFAAGIGHTALATRVVEHVERQRLPAHAFAFLRIEALLVARDFSGALEAIRRLRGNEADNALAAELLLDSLQAVAQLGLGDRDAARAFVSRVVLERGVRAQNLLAIANRFVDVDAADEACRLLTRAVAADPQNQAALSRLIELELNLNRTDSLPAHLLHFVRLRKPSADILRVALHKLGSDLFLFSPDRANALEAIHAALQKASGPVARN